jgi:hypothetical protein
MGRQDPGSGPVQGLELEQGIGVDDGGQVDSPSRRRTSARSSSPRPRPGPIANAEARSASSSTRSRGAFTASIRSVSTTGMTPSERRPRHTCVRAKRGFGGETERAGHPGRAPDDENRSCRVLRIALVAARDELQDLVGDETVPRVRVLEPDVRNLDLAHMEAPGSDHEPDLPAVHRHRDVCVDRHAVDLSCRRVDAGGDVDGDDGRVERVQLFDQRRRIRARCAREARSEQSVDDHVGVGGRPFARLRPASASTRRAILPSPPFAPLPQIAAMWPASG